MQHPSLSELAADVLPSGDVPFLALALVDGEGEVRDSHIVRRSDDSSPCGETVPHLTELKRAMRDRPRNEDLIACLQGCCMAVPLTPYEPGPASPPPSAREKKTFLVKNAFLAASTLPQKKPDSNSALIRVVLTFLGRELANRMRIAALADQVAFTESIVRSMSSGFIVLTPDLRVTHANPAAAALLQTTEKQLVGAQLTKFIFSELKVRKVFETGKPLIDEEVFIKLSGKTIHILKTCVPVLNERGEVVAVLDHFREIREARQLVSRLSGTRAMFTFADVIYASQAMGDAVELAKMASSGVLSILIQGESGTGKELFAHAIHQAGTRRAAPFVVIDCASMPRDLVESELFGYAEGAFTGARRGGRPGKFELAHGGTVFLDELGELPLELQSRLLRVLQNREVVRLGGAEPLPVDIRVIAATNRDLHEEIRQGNFRPDLFHRLNVLSINIPPLRSRKEDIPVLAKYFLQKYKTRLAKPDLAFSAESLAVLQSRQWSGNARELDNTIARAAQLCRGVIDASHMRPQQNAAPKIELDFAPATETQLPPLSAIEQKAFADAVAVCGGNISRAARMLGVARSTVYKKLRAK